VDASRTVAPENRAEREQLCQYVLRNPFSVGNLTLEPSSLQPPASLPIYRSKLNPKINRNFEVFDPVDFLAVLSHLPLQPPASSLGHLKSQIPDLKSLPPGSPPSFPCSLAPSSLQPLRFRQAWHTDPLQCPVCQKQMRVIAFIDHPDVVEKILGHLNRWGRPTGRPEAGGLRLQDSAPVSRLNA